MRDGLGLEGMGGDNLPPRFPRNDVWAARVAAAIAEIDAAHSTQKGATSVFVPADALITVQVAASYAADFARRS